MKKFLFLMLGAVILAPMAANAGTPLVFKEDAMILSRAAPTLVSEGFELGRTNGVGDVDYCEFQVCAPSGQTLTGGTIKLYQWSYVRSLWVYAQDNTWTLISSSERCHLFATQKVGVSYGRFVARSVAVTLSGAGTTIDTNFNCMTK